MPVMIGRGEGPGAIWSRVAWIGFGSIARYAYILISLGFFLVSSLRSQWCFLCFYGPALVLFSDTNYMSCMGMVLYFFLIHVFVQYIFLKLTIEGSKVPVPFLKLSYAYNQCGDNFGRISMLKKLTLFFFCWCFMHIFISSDEGQDFSKSLLTRSPTSLPM